MSRSLAKVARPAPREGALGRDAYRIVQEALTNIGKHVSGSPTWVRVSGAPKGGLHVNIRNRQPIHGAARPPLPGSGAGLRIILS
jgi:signal transduction histidine kinase